MLDSEVGDLVEVLESVQPLAEQYIIILDQGTRGISNSIRLLTTNISTATNPCKQ